MIRAAAFLILGPFDSWLLCPSSGFSTILHGFVLHASQLPLARWLTSASPLFHLLYQSVLGRFWPSLCRWGGWFLLTGGQGVTFWGWLPLSGFCLPSSGHWWVRLPALLNWISTGHSLPLSCGFCLLCVCSVAQLCLTICNPMDCSPPGSSVHGIFPARMLEWIAISCSRGSSWPRDWTHIFCGSCIGRQILYHWATWETTRSPLITYKYS